MPGILIRMNLMPQEQKGTSELKILIVDHSKVGWKRVSNLLDGVRDLELNGLDGDHSEMVNDIEELKPDVLILDIDTPAKKGIELFRQINQKYSYLDVIVLANASCPFFRKRCIEAGAIYFFDKATEFHKVPQAIKNLREAFHHSSN